MDYNSIQIGKIRNIDYNSGVGEVVSSEDSFIFRITDDTPNDLKTNDYVIFRAEQVQNQNIAFFIKKYTEENNQTLYFKPNKGNE